MAEENNTNELPKKKEDTFKKVVNKSIDIIKSNLNTTMLFCLIVGLGGIYGYASSVGTIGKQLGYMSILIGAAAGISGFFLGFLFGLPKFVNNGNSDSGYLVNNNLADISDWLTKIIIGVGLVEIKEIMELLIRVGKYVGESTGAYGTNMQAVTVFTICVIVYFGVFGVYYGYNYMRLVLSGAYRDADDELLKETQQELDTTKDQLEQTEAIRDEVIEKYNTADDMSTVLTEEVDEVNEGEAEHTSRALPRKLMSHDEFTTLLDRLKDKVKAGKARNIHDPNKNQWGGKTEANGRKISGTIKPMSSKNDYFTVSLTLESTDPNRPLIDGDAVFFSLHDTFNPPHKVVMVKNGTAKLNLILWGSFTIGIFADKGETELEIDLAELPGASQEFKER